MQNISYKALVVEEQQGTFNQLIKVLSTENLNEGDVLIRVHYSSVNYKDALSAFGNKGITKKYPHTPGIDAAGVVEQSENENFIPGDKVIVTGYDLGINTAGGFGEYICVPAKWIVKLPENLSLKESMILGTAGFTAGISVLRLSELVKPGDGKIIVSGASGGVGSIALSLLSKMGYQTVAVSAKETEYPLLYSLGVTEIISRKKFEEFDKRPILSAKYAGGIDTVGGSILENIIKSLQPLGVVTTCGNIASSNIQTSVYPFILRGISLIGVSSQNYPTKLRQKLWMKLATEWKIENFDQLHSEIKLEELKLNLELILNGKLKARTIVNLKDN